MLPRFFLSESGISLVWYFCSMLFEKQGPRLRCVYIGVSVFNLLASTTWITLSCKFPGNLVLFWREFFFVVFYLVLTGVYTTIGGKYLCIARKKIRMPLVRRLVCCCFVGGLLALLGGAALKFFLLMDRHFQKQMHIPWLYASFILVAEGLPALVIFFALLLDDFVKLDELMKRRQLMYQPTTETVREDVIEDLQNILGRQFDESTMARVSVLLEAQIQTPIIPTGNQR